MSDTPVGSAMVSNRLRKNLKHLRKWLQREDIHCYRLYDADIPEYAVAVDVYEGEQRRVHVQEYEAPATVSEEKAAERLDQALGSIMEVLEVPSEQVYLKVRRQQKGQAQYEKLDTRGEFHEVREGGNRFLVNFSDYLDTGLFLDHRITRALLGELAHDRDFLNLFAYTGSATVYAARGGARTTTTVDMSNTYLDWARRNMKLNGYSGLTHRFEQADCLTWLKQSAGKRRYGLIFLDPPSFSASKRMQGTFDVQRDHVVLIRSATALLQADGLLVFSNNRRGFRMDREALNGLGIEEISRKTLPKDFERNPKIHNCWMIRHAQ